MKSIMLDKLLVASNDLSFDNTHFKYQIASPSMLWVSVLVTET